MSWFPLESDGGNLDAGIEIGRAIWFREAATVVEEGTCASACALAWLAGRPRYMAPKARIGFHAPWRGDPDHPEASTGRERRGRRLSARPRPNLGGDRVHQRARPGRDALADAGGC